MTYQEIYDLYMKPYVEDEALMSRIEKGIEQNRKGNCRIRLVDANGKALAGARVKVKQTNAWKGEPNILIVAPPHLLESFDCVPMGGYSCVVKSRDVAKYYAEVAKTHGCAFLDAEGIAEFNKTDATHLTKKGHAALAAKLAEIVPTLV